MVRLVKTLVLAIWLLGTFVGLGIAAGTGAFNRLLSPLGVGMAIVVFVVGVIVFALCTLLIGAFYFSQDPPSR